MIELGLAPMLCPEGSQVSEAVMEAIKEILEDVFPVRVQALPAISSPPEAYDAVRRQHSAPVILKSLLAAHPANPAKLLAVTGGDLFIPMLSFVFGQAQLGGRAAVISMARLTPEFHGFDPDLQLLLRRARTVALHETGHLFGLTHCQTQECAMRLATNIHQFDLKRAVLCPGCAAILLENLR
jgi:archaemetzincin